MIPSETFMLFAVILLGNGDREFVVHGYYPSMPVCIAAASALDETLSGQDGIAGYSVFCSNENHEV